MGKHIIYKGNCLDKLAELENNSVHVCITSPPYFNAKQYGEEEDNVGKNKDYIDYLSKINKCIEELKRVLVPGGIVCWNTSPVLDGGERFMIPEDTYFLFIDNGFKCRDNLTWKKPDGAAKLRCGGWVQNGGKPLTWHPNIVDEKIMVYKKEGKREIGEFDKLSKYYLKIPKDLLTNVWEINPETHKSYHDAPFPEELVKRCILLYSFKGDTILDPFSGTFTTSKVARDLGRNSIGMELNEEYIKIGKENMGFYQKSLFGTEEYVEK
jgi:DNA modification methylase